METVPVILDGEKRGELKIVERGLVTVYEAEADYRGDGIIRLSVYGGGKRAAWASLCLRAADCVSGNRSAPLPPRNSRACRVCRKIR
jgi:hypothetical protein